MSTRPLDHLPSGRLMARNTVWNFVGLGTPLLVALVAIPRLIHALGAERFGFLPLAWTIIGYFSLFDMGLGRALTKLVSEKLARHEVADLPSLVWTAMALMLVLGIAGGVFAALLFPWLARGVLKIPPGMQDESIQAFYIIAASIPLVITTSGFRGILEAFQRFDLVNLLRVPLGMIAYLAPLMVLPFSHRLGPMMAALMAGRVLALGAHALLCLRVMPSLREGMRWQPAALAPLLRFGSWLMVSNIVAPLLVYMDRFFIGSLVSLTAVAYYATPFDLSNKLLLIPAAVAAVLFPGFSATMVSDRVRTGHLFDRSINYVLLIMFPVSLVLVSLAYPGMKLWLGAEFARNGAPVLQWLVVGTFVNAVAYIPYTLVQGGGRPDLTAKLHLAELPVYLLVLWWMIRSLGINGAAIAFTGRVVVDMLILFYFSGKMLPEGRGQFRKSSLVGAMMLLVLGLSAVPSSLPAQLLFLLVGLAMFVVCSWLFILQAEEKIIIRKLMNADMRVLAGLR